MTRRALGRDGDIHMEATREPAGVARLVTAVAIGDRNTGQGLVRNMVHRLAVGWRIGSAVASGALVGHRHLRVVPLGGLPARDAVATDAVHAGGDVHARLAGGGTAVVATGAVGAGVEQAVIRFRPQPGAGGLVAAFANCLTVVNGGCRARRGTKTGAHMAGGALRGYRHIGVELARVPAGGATFVAAVAIGNRYTAEGLVRYVVGRGPASRRKATGVARRALVRNCDLAVVPCSRLPTCGGVAADAIHRSGYVRTRLACGCTAVVTTSAIGATVEQAVIRFRPQPGAGGLVAAFANCLTVVNGGCRARRGTKAGAHMAGGALRGYRHIGVELARVPAGGAALVAAVAIGNRYTAEGLVRYVVGRGAAHRRESACMAAAALIGNWCLRVVPLGGLPAGDAVATDAVHAGGNVHARLAGGGTAVVATGAVGAVVEQAVIRFRPQPGAGGLVAAFANCLTVVNDGCRARRGTKTGAHMAGGALRGYRHIGVELARVPAGGATLVAAIAVGNRYTAEGLVRYVVGRGAVCWWKAS